MLTATSPKPIPKTEDHLMLGVFFIYCIIIYYFGIVKGRKIKSS